MERSLKLLLTGIGAVAAIVTAVVTFNLLQPDSRTCEEWIAAGFQDELTHEEAEAVGSGCILGGAMDGHEYTLEELADMGPDIDEWFNEETNPHGELPGPNY